MEGVKLTLANPKNGYYARIEYSVVAERFKYIVHAGRSGLMGFRGEITTKLEERGYTKTLKGAKSAVSQALGYKSEWK